LINDYTRKENEMTDYPDLETVITRHIANNFYPSLPGAAVECGVKAVELCNDGDFDAPVELPSGRTLPAQDIVDDLKLWDLVDYEED